MSAIRENTAVLPWSAARSGADVLRALVVITGLCWSLAFVIVALDYDLQLYGDGAMFSYAVAAQDVWAFHWHNISGRLTVFLLTLWPAELFAGATENPWDGVVAYGFLFYVAPLVGLLATFSADHSRSRIFSPMPVSQPPCSARSYSVSRPKCGWRTRFSGRRLPSPTTRGAAFSERLWYFCCCSRWL